MDKRKLYIVGAGPGAPDLITLRGYRILKEAELVIHDYLVDSNLFINAGIEAEFISVKDISTRKGALDSKKELSKINEMMIKYVIEGKKVVRLKNGDPVIFSRLADELKELKKHNIEYEVVPGLTAASVAASRSGIPLTDRRIASSCVFVTGQEDPKKETSSIDWSSISKAGTIVVYMGIGRIQEITNSLLKAGKPEDTPVLLVKNISLPNESFIPGRIDDICDKVSSKDIRPPAILIVGEVAKFEKDFNWSKKNNNILFTGLSDFRPFSVGNYCHFPLIEIKPLENYSEFDEYIRFIRKYDWIIFASRYGVKYFFERFKNLGFDSRDLSSLSIAAIGNSTLKKLDEFGIKADLVPENESSAGLLEEFEKIDIKGKKIFMPRSDISGKNLDTGLRAMGAEVVSSFAYRNVMTEDLPEIDIQKYDEIMFTSPSTVRSFKKRFGALPDKKKIKCIGEVTKTEVEKCGTMD